MVDPITAADMDSSLADQRSAWPVVLVMTDARTPDGVRVAISFSDKDMALPAAEFQEVAKGRFWNAWLTWENVRAKPEDYPRPEAPVGDCPLAFKGKAGAFFWSADFDVAAPCEACGHIHWRNEKRGTAGTERIKVIGGMTRGYLKLEADRG